MRHNLVRWELSVSNISATYYLRRDLQNELTPKYAKITLQTRRSQHGLPHSRRAGLIAMVLPNGRSAANDRKNQEEQAGYFQPEHVQDASDAAEGGGARSVKSPDPAILAALPSRDAEKRPALSTEIAG